MEMNKQTTLSLKEERDKSIHNNFRCMPMYLTVLIIFSQFTHNNDEYERKKERKKERIAYFYPN
jgi:fucose permease